MGGMRGASSGSTGAATTTVWFGNVPDRINMLRPCKQDVRTTMEFTAANYMNQMIIWDEAFLGGTNPTGSFGSFTTAPDGTTDTAQKFVEAAINQYHATFAGFFGTDTGDFGKIRFAGFFKYAGRRISLKISGFYSQNAGAHRVDLNGGVSATFDLLNGVIGIEAAIYGQALTLSLWEAPFSQMVHYGDGWYLCSVEVNIISMNTQIKQEMFCTMNLDNGTGSDPESSVYVGDGSSGVYGWKTNVMPVRAYGLNSATLFEDFDDFSGIDIDNTMEPGFNFYMVNPYPVLHFTGSPPETFSISDSVLTIGVYDAFAFNMVTATSTGITPGSAYVGRAFRGPWLHEARWTYPFSIDATTLINNVGPFSEKIAWFMNQPELANAGTGYPVRYDIQGMEIDFSETRIGGSQDHNFPAFNWHIYNITGGTSAPSAGWSNESSGVLGSIVGYAHWSAVKQYRPNNACLPVYHVGTDAFYRCNTQHTNQEPPNASFWDSYPPSTDGVVAPGVAVNLDEMHTYQTFYFPAEKGECGAVMGFFDGIFAFANTWSPTNVARRPVGADTGEDFFIYNGGEAAGGGNATWSCDWVRITQ